MKNLHLEKPKLLKASALGKNKIKKALKQRKWTTQEDNTEPLIKASLIIVEEIELNEYSTKWLEKLEKIFYFPDHSFNIEKVKQQLFSSEKSYLNSIKNLIITDVIRTKNISYGTWNKFYRGHKIKQHTFKVYCKILNLNWQEIVDIELDIDKFHNKLKSIVQVHTKYLLNIQNDDGGWGIEEFSTSSPLNTAEVCYAILKISDRNNLSTETINKINKSVDFLLDKQCHDGGWSTRIISQDTHLIGDTMATAWVLKFFTNYQTSKKISYAIQRGYEFILSRSNKGYWSDDNLKHSSVAATCYSLLALLESDKLSLNQQLRSEIKAKTKNAITWLDSILNLDGGIGFSCNDEDSKYSSTALLAITLNLLQIQGKICLPLTKVMLCIQKILDVPSENILKSESEYTLRFQYEHFTFAMLTRALFTSDNQDIILVKAYIIKLTELSEQLKSGGCSPNFFDINSGRKFTWSTAKLLLSLSEAITWLLKNQ